jgi:4-carboxymuconolactone decarboxylase
MDERTLKKKTARTAEQYFHGFPWERPYNLWRSFDRELAKELSLFITGQMYAREKLPHETRQLVAIAALTALGRPEELRMHIWAGLNVGLTKEEVAESIFQVAIYAGMPVVNQALAVLREVLEAREEGS